jgi:hypothetical protein
LRLAAFVGDDEAGRMLEMNSFPPVELEMNSFPPVEVERTFKDIVIFKPLSR